MSLSHSPKIVTNGLVLLLDAANPRSYPGSGTTWTDLSGLGNNATLINSPTYDLSNNGSIVFNGTNSYASVADASSLSFSNNTFTFDYWVNFTSVANIGMLGKMNTWEYAFSSPSSGVLRFYIWNLSGSQVYSTPSTISTNVVTSTWYNHVYTADGANSTLYVNGVSVATSSKGANNMGDGTNPLIIGAGGDAGGWKYLNGKLPLLKMYNRSLSSNEIRQNFNALRGRYGV